MTADQLRATLARLGLTVGAAARVLGLHRRTVEYYLAGDRPVHPSTARLLAACERFPAVLEWLREE